MSKYKAFSNQSKSFDCNNSQNDNGLNKINVSFFDNVRSKKPTKKTLFESLTPTNEQIALIAKCRQILDKNERSRFKKKFIPAISIGGIYKNGHKGANLEKASNLVAIDFDSVEDLETLKSQLSNLPYIAYISLSVSGNGLFCIIKIDDYQKWNKDAYTRLIGEIGGSLTTTCNPDQSCSDYCRLRYISYDDQSYTNLQATTYVLDNSPMERPAEQPTAKRVKLDGTDSEWKRVMSATYKTRWGITGFIDGNKHNFLYTVARYANYMGIPEKEYFRYIEQNYYAKYSSNFSDPYRNESDRFGIWQNLSTQYLPTKKKSEPDFIYKKYLTQGDGFSKEIPRFFKSGARILLDGPTGCGKSYSIFNNVIEYVKENIGESLKVMVCAPYNTIQDGWDVVEYGRKHGFLFCMKGKENANKVDISKQFFASSFKQARTLHKRLIDAGNRVLIIFDETHELIVGQFQKYHSIVETLKSRNTMILGYSATHYAGYFERKWGFEVIQAEPETRNIPNVQVHVVSADGYENKLLELSKKAIGRDFEHVMTFAHDVKMLKSLTKSAQEEGLTASCSYSDSDKENDEPNIDLESIKSTKKQVNQIFFSSSKNATGVDSRDADIIASLNNVTRNNYSLFTQMSARSRNTKHVDIVLLKPKKPQTKGGKKDFDYKEEEELENACQQYCDTVNFMQKTRSLANDPYLRGYLNNLEKTKIKNEFTGLIYKDTSGTWQVNDLAIAKRQIDEINLNYSNDDIINIIRNDSGFNLIGVSYEEDTNETSTQAETKLVQKEKVESTKQFLSEEKEIDGDKATGIDILCEYGFLMSEDPEFKQRIIRCSEHVARLNVSEIFEPSIFLNDHMQEIKDNMDYATIEMLIGRFQRLMSATKGQATKEMIDYSLNIKSHKQFGEYIDKINRAFIRRIDSENCPTLSYALVEVQEEKREVFGYRFEKLVQEAYRKGKLTFSKVTEIYRHITKQTGYDPIRISKEQSKATQQITQYFSERFNYEIKQSKLRVSTGSKLEIKRESNSEIEPVDTPGKAQPVDKKADQNEPVDTPKNPANKLKRRKSVKYITNLNQVSCLAFGSEYAKRVDKIIEPITEHIKKAKAGKPNDSKSSTSKEYRAKLNKQFKHLFKLNGLGYFGESSKTVTKSQINPNIYEAELLREIEEIWNSKGLDIAI